MPPLISANTLDILYQDEQFVAIHKPSGLMVHRSNIARQEKRFAVQMLRDQLGQPVHPVHRLDRGTSGVLLFSLNRSHALDWTSVEKKYLAIVRGHPAAEGMIDYPLRKKVDTYAGLETEDATPQEAVTAYRTLATLELPIPIAPYATSRFALVLLSPATGRRHQLRRHMKHIAHPIIGDATYGKGPVNRSFKENFGSDRLLLACVEIGFIHPIRQTLIHIQAPLKGEFRRAIATLGWEKALPSAWLSD